MIDKYDNKNNYRLHVGQGSRNEGSLTGQRTFFCEKNIEALFFISDRHIIYR